MRTKAGVRRPFQIYGFTPPLIDLETLGYLHRCAKHHAPQGNVDFKCIPHSFAPRRLVEPTLET